MPKVTYSINGFRRGLARSLKELKEDLDAVLDDVHSDDAARIKDSFNEIACSSNSFNCVHVDGFEDFDSLAEDPEVELFDT